MGKIKDAKKELNDKKEALDNLGQQLKLLNGKITEEKSSLNDERRKLDSDAEKLVEMKSYLEMQKNVVLPATKMALDHGRKILEQNHEELKSIRKSVRESQLECFSLSSDFFRNFSSAETSDPVKDALQAEIEMLEAELRELENAKAERVRIYSKMDELTGLIENTAMLNSLMESKILDLNHDIADLNNQAMSSSKHIKDQEANLDMLSDSNGDASNSDNFRIGNTDFVPASSLHKFRFRSVGKRDDDKPC